jgi:hypothetical protein
MVPQEDIEVFEIFDALSKLDSLITSDTKNRRRSKGLDSMPLFRDMVSFPWKVFLLPFSHSSFKSPVEDFDFPCFLSHPVPDHVSPS